MTAADATWLHPRTAALVGIALAWLSFIVLAFAGYGGERAACPGTTAVAPALAVTCAVVATVGFALAIWAYRATAGEPSADWLLGAAGLYVSVLGWAATVTAAVALLSIDLC